VAARERHRVRAELAQLDRGLPQRGAAARATPTEARIFGSISRPNATPGPPAEDDALRVEQVDEVRDAGAEVPGGLIEDLGRHIRRGGPP
jgi:hypothetical protein